MKINKMKKFSLAASIMGLAAITLPLLTLTSCAQTWAYVTPVATGSSVAGQQGDPYRNFRSTTSAKYEDADGDRMVNYLQSNYVTYPTSNVVAFYSYAQPVSKWHDDNEKFISEKFEYGNASWYGNGDSSFNRTYTFRKDNKNKTEYCFQNSVLDDNTSFICGISAKINSILTSALNYQASQINIPADNNKDLSVAWGVDPSNLSFGATDLDTKNFYEYIFASGNSHGIGVCEAFMKTASVNFEFAGDDFTAGKADPKDGNFPIPSYEHDTNEVSNISPETKALLYGSSTGTFLNQDNGHLNYFDKITAGSEEKDGVKDIKFHTFNFVNVPIVVKLINSYSTYVNGTKSGSFLPTNYYVEDGTAIKNIVGNTWKNTMSKYVNDKPEACIPTTKSFNVKPSATPASVGLDTKKKEYDHRLPENLEANDFVILANYSVKEYDDINYKKYNSVSLSNVSTILPAYILKEYANDPDLYKKIDNSKMPEGFDKKEFGYKINVEKFTSTDKSKPGYLTQLSDIYNHKSEDGKKNHASEISAEGKKLLTFLKYMFADQDGKLNFSRAITIPEDQKI